LIKHKIEENNLKSLNNLIRVNSIFPIELSELAKELGFRVIQVATDCVFSGAKGSYTESDIKDPVDNYGYSKVLGEHLDDHLITLRCSLIGKELNTRIEFLEWVLSHSKESEVGGFTNHHWNGLTTMHYAKIISGIMKRNYFTAGTFHVVPENSVTKFQLSQIILDCFGSSEIKVAPVQSPKSINRTLATNNEQFNLDMWRDAGYNKPLNIAEMIKEYSLWA
jgi:dTDP-4-dehydrorhamnose reductase